mmetsp:Transcript_22894/g.47807  ORF Transcript_22894/g.47807 Transcript_22894/m.47807 type:complete len:206 (+) Transcript_22894:1101-1718(+)
MKIIRHESPWKSQIQENSNQEYPRPERALVRKPHSHSPSNNLQSVHHGYEYCISFHRIVDGVGLTTLPKPIPNPPVKRRVQCRNERRHAHDPRASLPVERRMGAQTPSQEGETRQQSFQVGGDVGGVESGGVGRLLGPYLPEDAEVGEGGEGDGAHVLDCGSDAGECRYAVGDVMMMMMMMMVVDVVEQMHALMRHALMHENFEG